MKTLQTSEASDLFRLQVPFFVFSRKHKKRPDAHPESSLCQSGSPAPGYGNPPQSELTRSLQDGSVKNTLLSVLDYTVTAMGGRLIRNWIEQPLLDLEKIESRLAAVEELVHKPLYRSDLKDELKQIYDLERLAGKISYGSANARDLVALKKSLGYLPSLKKHLEQAESTLLQETGRDIDPMPKYGNSLCGHR